MSWVIGGLIALLLALVYAELGAMLDRPRFHILFLDGVYVLQEKGKLRFRQVAPPTAEELQELLHRIAHRVAGYLERQGLLEREVENSYLQSEKSISFSRYYMPP